MKVGLLYPYNDKKYKEDKEVLGVGLEPQDLLDTINILEANNGGNAMMVLAKFKYQLLQLTGKIETKQETKEVK